MFNGALNFSLIKKAQEKGLVEINLTNIRDFSSDKHKTVDDTVYGGGSGMVLKAEPLTAAIKKSKLKNPKIIFMTPSGKRLDQETAKRLSKEKELIVICGHYEGIDQRVRDKYVDEEISIGDYVLTGGELPALVLVDTICRLVPGVVKEKDSLVNDSFYNGLLDHPSYTRPDDFEGDLVPDVLKSGNHKEIERWRRKESLKKTLFVRPDLLESLKLEKEDKNLLQEIILE